MKRHWWVVGVGLALFSIGCTQTLEDAQKAASEAVEKASAEATAQVEAAGEKAKTAVEGAGEVAKTAVEGAGEEAKAAVEGAVGEVSLKVGDVDVGQELTTVMDGLKTTLGEVTDVATAKIALPKLEQANLGLDKLMGLVDQLPEAAKPLLAKLLKSQSAAIIETVQKVVGIEGVGEILKPVLEQIAAKLAKAAGTDVAAPAP